MMPDEDYVYAACMRGMAWHDRYVAVGEARFFYYFIESERSPEEDPVLLWLTGGPGCSAFSGLIYEIGNVLKYFTVLLKFYHRY